MPECTFIRVLEATDKAAALHQAIAHLRAGAELPGTVFRADPDSFSAVPTTPFAYWVSDRVRRLFTELPPFEGEGRTARVGLQTSDDFRFLRAWWEVSPARTVSGTAESSQEEFRRQTHEGKPWVPFAKGGAYSPYYADLHLVVNWGQDGAEIRNLRNRSGKLLSRPQNVDYYFRPGLTWPSRTNGLSFRALPRGTAFGHKGPAAFTKDRDQCLMLLGLMNSSTYEALVRLMLGRTELAQSYEVGVVQKVPIPELDPESQSNLRSLASSAIACAAEHTPFDELTHSYIVFPAHRDESDCADLKTLRAELNRLALELYGLEEVPTASVDRDAVSGAESHAGGSGDDDDEAEFGSQKLLINGSRQCASYLLGLCFGRWDIRFATGEREVPELPDPFAPLPVCSPGMLQGPGGLPARPADLPAAYPLRIAWQGVMVDDRGHPGDVVGWLRKALSAIWGEQSADIEQEICQELEVASLRDYLQTPLGFFDSHLKQYSMSRRKAPIYWPLSTPSGSYTLWLYYPRLTDQTLYLAVNDYVDPRLLQVQEQAEELRLRSNSPAKRERELEHLLDLQDELLAFRQELLRIAAFWKPNHDDGVQITAAPLWRLFRHRAWQKRLEDTWAALEKGDYDWAHLAYSIWPDRVEGKCRQDKSLAIAHGLEHLYVEPEAKPKSGRSRRSR